MKKTPEQISYNMSRIKNKDTKIEVILRKKLWSEGIRYRKNYFALPGKPDIVITKYRIAIFCDSEFFHGKDWEQLKEQISKGKNPDFWIKKITRNMERDKEVTKELKDMGWKVLRFWGKDIQRDVDQCVKTVKETIFDLKVSNSCMDDDYS